MQAGYFNMGEYMSKLNEAEDGNLAGDKDGLIIPDENKKAYDWFKKEYDANQTEVKVEVRNGKDKYEPDTEIQQTDSDVKDFKTGDFSTDQKAGGDGTKSDFKPFSNATKTSSGDTKNDSETADTETTDDEKPAKKKVSVTGVKTNADKKPAKSKAKPSAAKAVAKDDTKDEDKDKDKDK